MKDNKKINLPFEDKSAAEQGIDTSRYFTTIVTHGEYEKGDLLYLKEDDGSYLPYFWNLSQSKSKSKALCCYWKNLRYATQEEIDAVLGKKEKTTFQENLEEEGKKLKEEHGKSKLLTHSQFLEYTKKHGATKARITEDWIYPAGSILEFHSSFYGLFSYDEKRGTTIFGSYRGLFEIVEGEETGRRIVADEVSNINWDIAFGLMNMRYKQPNKSLKEKIMNGVVKFIKNATLSAEEKLLRENGLKNECGEYTEAYEDIRNFLLNQEYEAKVVEQLKAKLEEESKK